MVPPGAHIISFNTVSKEGDFSPTMSFFVYLKAGEVHLYRELPHPKTNHDLLSHTADLQLSFSMPVISCA